MADINFIILKINSIDVSEMPHNEALQMFLKAPEPMMLEVRRPIADDLNKLYICSAKIPIVSLCSSTSSTSSSLTTPDNDEKRLKSPDSIIVAGQSPEKDTAKKYFITTGVQTDAVLADYIFSGSSIGDQSNNDHIFDECLSPEIDIEEVTLRKAASSEKLGLTVSYSSGSDDTDTCTEVYISDIIPNSVAGRDGRLRQGDQILQVNGRDVSNKEDTETLIAENKNAVTFLVSRYLYMDDDFNETYDDYDHDDLQITYQNCGNVKEMRSSSEQTNTSSTSKSSSSHKSAIGKKAVTANPKDIIAKLDALNHLNIEAHLESVNNELALLDSRVENMMLHSNSKPARIKASHPAANDSAALNQNNYIYRTPIDNMKKTTTPIANNTTAINTTTTSSSSSTEKPIPTKSMIGLARKKFIESDTEHIYETIPEDLESEPFYCLPYETADQNLVEQWLEMQTGSGGTAEIGKKLQRKAETLKNFSSRRHHSGGGGVGVGLKSTIKSNSSGEDHENSSSAYNTGGSCNSNNHLTLELNSNDDELGGYQRSIAVLYNTSPQQIQNTDNIGGQTYSQDINDNCEECQRQKKEKPLILSPKHDHQKLLSPQKLQQQQRLMILQQQQQQHQSSNSFSSTVTQILRPDHPSFKVSPKIPAETMYTNMANLKRTMLLQQKLFRQALIRQTSGVGGGVGLTTSSGAATTLATTAVPDRPHFNAPNLSQYHFVSSQEVSTATTKPYPSDEQMEWKVKRRQDGTRYIVRRPTRNRILRDRALRLRAERNELTTEDDTISEIKTGRYWSKDERKKHFERAKERRLRQQMLILNKCETDGINGIKQPSQTTTANVTNRSATLPVAATPPTMMTTVAMPTFECCQTLQKKSMKKKRKDENPATAINDNDNKIIGLLSVTTV